MITIRKSPTADTRTCDFSQVTKDQLLSSSHLHRGDVAAGLHFFINMLVEREKTHDDDKLRDIAGFHRDFLTGFKETTWWDNHRKITRHHLLQADGIPEDVDLIDVLEMIVDCVMAGMARSGSVYPVEIDREVLMKAFNNTVDFLKSKIEVVA